MRCRGELTETGAGLPGQPESEGACGPRLYSFQQQLKLHPALVHCVDAEAESGHNFQLTLTKASKMLPCPQTARPR